MKFDDTSKPLDSSTARGRRPHVVPEHRLPEGLAQSVDRTPETVAEAKPAATVVLVRDGTEGLEALLMRRHRRAGFVPGAWVFPGGRVDAADADPGYWAGSLPESPAAHFWVAAAREVFEETGVLLAEDPSGGDSGRDAETLRHWRLEVLEDRVSLLDALRDLRLRLALEDTIHFAHWVTPIVEPRRYDTHFFLARLPDGAEITADPREMTDALWTRPATALDRFELGELPMVFPTVRVLESLAPHRTVQDALDALRGTVVRTIMPRLVRVKDGIAFLIDEEGSD